MPFVRAPCGCTGEVWKRAGAERRTPCRAPCCLASGSAGRPVQGRRGGWAFLHRWPLFSHLSVQEGRGGSAGKPTGPGKSRAGAALGRGLAPAGQEGAVLCLLLLRGLEQGLQERHGRVCCLEECPLEGHQRQGRWFLRSGGLSSVSTCLAWPPGCPPLSLSEVLPGKESCGGGPWGSAGGVGEAIPAAL